MLVQPATVDRWRREGFRRCWARRGRRPGRPCIDSQCRALIRRLAADNRLWGAPRIHGELLKLGIVVSERSVSRYLPDRLTAPSQTWRTFLANHVGVISPVMSSYAPDDVADASGLPFRPARLSPDGPCASNRWQLSIGLVRSDARLWACVSPKITFTTGQGREKAPAGTRRRMGGYNWPHGVRAEVPFVSASIGPL